MLTQAQNNGTSIREGYVRSLLNPTQHSIPWSPLSVAVISFILPAGGAVLTLHNLRRLHILDEAQMRPFTIGVILVYAFGMSILLALGPTQASGTPQLDPDAYSVVQFGFAAAAYLVQRAPYRLWHKSNVGRPGSWTSGVVTSLIYQFLGILATVPIYAVIAVFVSAGLSGS